MNLGKITADLLTYTMAAVSLFAIGVSPNFPRAVIDRMITLLSIIFPARDGFLVYYQWKCQAEYSYVDLLRVVEAACGLGVAVCAAVSLGLQVQEPPPKNVDPAVWDTILVLKVRPELRFRHLPLPGLYRHLRELENAGGYCGSWSSACGWLPISCGRACNWCGSPTTTARSESGAGAGTGVPAPVFGSVASWEGFEGRVEGLGQVVMAGEVGVWAPADHRLLNLVGAQCRGRLEPHERIVGQDGVLDGLV